MTQSTEIECIGFTNNNIFMADTNSNPIRSTLFDLEMEYFFGLSLDIGL
jgi:hypothetical protein